MRYTMKSGVLYEDASRVPLVKMKSAITGPVKMIYCNNEIMAIKTDICCSAPQKNQTGDTRSKVYIMKDGRDALIAVGKPGYAKEDEPETAGWPVCRVPRVDHADLTIENQQFLLMMHNSQNYSLRDGENNEILRILHKGIAGGWSIEDLHGFSPEVICGIFAFCRYIEQENEFIIV